MNIKEIASYKAELLKEVGEPVAWLHIQGNYSEVSERQLDDDEISRGWEQEGLFTSDQVAAAVLKATKPLEDQLAAAQEEITRRVTVDEMNAEIDSASKAVAKHYEDLLATAEQRVAELTPGNGKEISERMKRLATNAVWRYSADQNKAVDMSDSNIQELFALIDHLCIGVDSPANTASS